MAKDPDQIAAEGRDVTETTRTPGWKLIQGAITEAREDLEQERIDLVDTLGQEGTDTDAVVLKIARLNGQLEGLRSTEDITSLMLRRKEGAESKLRTTP